MTAGRPAGSDPGAERARLREHAAALDVQLDDAALDDLLTYLDDLERWNTRANLVGEHDRATLIDRHLVDSLAAVPLLRGLGDRVRIADVGSGAGLPGIPLAIALRPAEMLLIEPRRKRASFLRAMRRTLATLPLQVEEGRAEDVDSAARAPFDAVVSRAALADDALREVAAPFLRPGGLLVAYRGDDAGDVDEPAVGGYGAAVRHHYVLRHPSRRFALVVRERICFT